MGIGFAGIGAGADWNGLINQLLQIESRPLDKLRSQEEDINKQISDFGRVKSIIDEFKAVVDDLQSDTGFGLFNRSSSDESVLTIQTDNSAVASSYDVVVEQLASRDKLASSVYTDAVTSVGTGTLTITVGADTLDITVDPANNTLEGLRDAINTATGNPGVAATILNEAGGSRLILTGRETGASNVIAVSVVDADDGNGGDANGLSRLFHVGAGDDGLAERVSNASDALLTIDGFDIESSSNSVTAAITGVTLELVSTGSASVQIERDNVQLEEKVNQFVDAYNKLLDDFEVLEISSLGKDSGLRRMEQGFVDILNQPATVDSEDMHLFEIGISRDKLGRISLDSDKFSEMLADDFNRFSQLFTDDTAGYATRFFNYADQLLDTGGFIDAREDGLDSRKRSIQESIDRQERHLELVERSLIEEFAALDRTMASLQSTGNYLAGQLGALLG